MRGHCPQRIHRGGVAGLAPGDPVALGQVIGFVGNGVMDEADLPSHLHLRVTRDGNAIDPSLLWH